MPRLAPAVPAFVAGAALGPGAALILTLSEGIMKQISHWVVVAHGWLGLFLLLALAIL